MALKYLNHTGNTTVTVVDAQSVENTTTGKIDRTFNANIISSMSICNTHGTDAVAVDLFLTDKATGTLTYTILNNLSIPVNSTVFLDNFEAAFDNKDYRMQMQLSASDSRVSVIIK